MEHFIEILIIGLKSNKSIEVKNDSILFLNEKELKIDFIIKQFTTFEEDSENPIIDFSIENYEKYENEKVSFKMKLFHEGYINYELLSFKNTNHDYIKEYSKLFQLSKTNTIILIPPLNYWNIGHIFDLIRVTSNNFNEYTNYEFAYSTVSSLLNSNKETGTVINLIKHQNCITMIKDGMFYM
jgi:hypothetical protein